MASSSSARRSAPTRSRRSSRRRRPTCCCSTCAFPTRSGLEVNRWLAEHHPDVRVVMLTMSEDHDTALTALRDGASGYLVKGAGPERVEHALRTVAAGDVVLDHISRPGGHRAGPGAPRVDQPAVPAADQPRVRHPANCSPKASTTRPSPAAWCSARRPFATTSPTSSPRSRRRIDPAPSCWPTATASEPDREVPHSRPSDKPVDHEEWRDNTHSPHRVDTERQVFVKYR